MRRVVVPIGLLMNDVGNIGTPCPRITITVAGEPLDLDYAHKKVWFTCIDGCEPARVPDASRLPRSS